ncbi:hypothetical protein JDV09_17545 [Mycobacterium sp. Y57]|nr:hypothetical protein [Mycolicibacterium xanthum]
MGVDYPWTPRFSADGTQIYFTGTPLDGTRSELHVVNVDGTGVQCLTCGLSPEVTQDLFKAVPTYDGSGRVLVQVETGLAASAMIYEPGGYEGNSSARLVPIIPPPSNPAAGEPNGYVLGVSPLQEPRISPDGQHILFNRLGANGLPPQFGGDGYFGVVPVVGELQRTTNATTGQIEYVIVDPVVIAAAGESKNWTPDGKGVICLCGLNEQGNADNVIIDLATGEVTRLNGNLDYDEDMDLSPNQQWMAVGSLRSFDGLTPATRIVRPATLPFYIQGAVYTQYALPLNISNQEWLVAVEDDLKRENGIPLFVQGDGLPGEPNGDDWTARSMPGWNADGTAVVFWEYDLNNPNEDARLVIANVKYTTSVGTITDRSTPDLWVPDPDNVEPGKFQFQPLKTYVLGPPPLPPTGTYQGVGGGSYTITEKDDPDTVNRAGYTVRTVTYDNYNNGDGMILNGSESTSSKAGLNTVYYLADIDVTDAVTGENRGYVRGDARINTLQRSITPTTPDDPATPDINESSMIRSSLDGDLLYLLDQQRYQLNLAEQ